MTKENLDFGLGHGRNFGHLNMVYLKLWPWSCSKFVDHMTMTPGHRPNGQKVMVVLQEHVHFKILWSHTQSTVSNNIFGKFEL